jgi:hypothetical protein
MSHPRGGVGTVGSPIVTLEIRRGVITARIAKATVRRFQHTRWERRIRRSNTGTSLAMMSGREESGEFWTARFWQTLRTQHETISDWLRKLTGAGSGKAVTLVMMTLIGSWRVCLQLRRACLSAPGHLDLQETENSDLTRYTFHQIFNFPVRMFKRL